MDPVPWSAGRVVVAAHKIEIDGRWGSWKCERADGTQQPSQQGKEGGWAGVPSFNMTEALALMRAKLG
jgi:hypothetical protein